MCSHDRPPPLHGAGGVALIAAIAGPHAPEPGGVFTGPGGIPTRQGGIRLLTTASTPTQMRKGGPSKPSRPWLSSRPGPFLSIGTQVSDRSHRLHPVLIVRGHDPDARHVPRLCSRGATSCAGDFFSPRRALPAAAAALGGHAAPLSGLGPPIPHGQGGEMRGRGDSCFSPPFSLCK
jgi:hypothetical protein